MGGSQHDDRDQTVSPAATALAAMAAVVGGFAAFGTFLWTNIHVDGDPDATAIETVLAVAPLAVVLWVPAIAVVVISRWRGAKPLRRQFGLIGALALGVFTFGYGLVAVAGIVTLWAVSALARRRPLKDPPLDLAVLGSYALLLWYVAFQEANR